MDVLAQLRELLADRYRIEREIGRGGMATVYLARDVRHDRLVALKVLDPELGAVLGVERFLAEIKVTANLQHPNLLPLFDSGEAGGLLFYVMPYVEGESLRVRLDRERQLPVEEAVRIAIAIANALDYAHAHHVIHRDLKPENILMQAGQPVIADFGIALAVSKAGGARITQTGLSLGTPQYMSPEQATGDRAIDGRTDIYSLGAITFEMLVGDPPHAASTAQAVIAKVLTERPRSVHAVRASVPMPVDAAIARALEKLAADRFATAHEFAEALAGRGATGSAHYEAAPSAASVRRDNAWRAATGVLAVSLLAATVFAMRARSSAVTATDSAPVIRAHLEIPIGHRFADALTGTTLVVSPRGDLVAFTTVDGSGYSLWVRRVNEFTARPLTNKVVAARNLTFSPDGQRLAFTEGNVLKQIPIAGGDPETIGSTGGTVPYGLAWSESGRIYIGSYSGMFSADPGGGGTTPVIRRDSTGLRVGQRWPILVPGGKAAIYATGNGSGTVSTLALVELATGELHLYDLPLAVPLGVLGDELVYVTAAGELKAVRIDLRTGAPLGEPQMLEEGVLVDGTNGVKGSLSESGTLALVHGRPQYQPMLVDPRTGTTRSLHDELRTYGTPRFSPDGSRVAMTVFSQASTDIWIYDLAHNTFSRLTTEGANLRPEWSPDSKQVIFISQRNGGSSIMQQPADRSGPAAELFKPAQEPFEALISPDRQWIVYRTAPAIEYPRDILAVRTTGDRTVRELAVGASTESMPRLSPDGKWLAYQSNESQRFEIYVRPFPNASGPVQVSTDGGSEPIWGHDGRTLYYRGPLGEVIRVAVTTGGQFSIGERREVLKGDYLMDSSHPNWDVAPDGRFLMLRRAGGEPELVLVHNWGRELRERTAGRR